MTGLVGISKLPVIYVLLFTHHSLSTFYLFTMNPFLCRVLRGLEPIPGSLSQGYQGTTWLECQPITGNNNTHITTRPITMFELFGNGNETTVGNWSSRRKLTTPGKNTHRTVDKIQTIYRGSLRYQRQPLSFLFFLMQLLIYCDIQ